MATRINAVLAAGYNFSRLLRRPRRLFRALFQALLPSPSGSRNPLKIAAQPFFTDDYR
jgi:hypothetical protein